jgi:hypothetical protein
VETFFREAPGLGDDDIATMRAQPSWPARVAAAPTLPRELRNAPADLLWFLREGPGSPVSGKA